MSDAPARPDGFAVSRGRKGSRDASAPSAGPAAPRVHVIYDAQCGLCIRSLALLRTADFRKVLRFHDGNDRSAVEARFPVLRGANLDEAMWVVTPDGRAHPGFFALRRLLAVSPATWPLLAFFYLPGASWIGRRVYAWVARNRRRFGCGAGICVLPKSSD